MAFHDMYCYEWIETNDYKITLNKNLKKNSMNNELSSTIYLNANRNKAIDITILMKTMIIIIISQNWSEKSTVFQPLFESL